MHRNSWGVRGSDPQWYSEEVRGVAKESRRVAWTGKEKGENMASINLTADQVFAINAALAKGQRVELIPLKDRLKIVVVKRDELKTK